MRVFKNKSVKLLRYDANSGGQDKLRRKAVSVDEVAEMFIL